jgi:AraC-like DNA-binding protein
MRHELELSTNELELMKMRRRNMIWVFVSLIAFLLVASFYLLWRRQKRMCRILVDQHVHYVQQIEMLQAGVKQVNTPPYDDKDAAERELFLKLDAFMSKDKLFRQKDVSLDLLAQMTDSNRTYVSKAVNHYAGQSFSSWLNMYRIAEAIRLMSREDEMPLKQIADEVGYASMSVFYNAFCKETGLPPGRYRKELQNRKILPDS